MEQFSIEILVDSLSKVEIRHIQEKEAKVFMENPLKMRSKLMLSMIKEEWLVWLIQDQIQIYHSSLLHTRNKII